MPKRYLVTMLILTAGLWAATPQFASAGQPRTISTSEVERAVMSVFNSGRALEQIDRGHASGALTWSEASALYQEQAAIRSAFIQGRALHGRELAARRAAFMLRMSQSTYARLAFNEEQRRPVQRQVTWVW